MEVNFQACELLNVSFSTDKDLRILQAFYTQQFPFWCSTGFDLVFNWFSSSFGLVLTGLAQFELVLLQVLGRVYNARSVYYVLSVFELTSDNSHAKKYPSLHKVRVGYNTAPPMGVFHNYHMHWLIYV